MLDSSKVISRDSVLKVEGISASYGKKSIIDNLTLTPIRPGIVTALVGPNAAGKSTLLRSIAGLIPITGKLTLGDSDLARMSHVERAKHITFMPQSMPQGISLSVFEVVLSALKASPMGFSRSDEELHDHVTKVLDRIGIVDIGLRPLNELSGGQRQMVSLAQVVARDPHVLLLDEPTSALDLKHQVKVMSLVHSLAQEGRAVVVVLHDLSLASRWAENVVVIDGGKVVAEGSPESAITPKLLADVYGVEARIERCGAGRINVIVDSAIS